MKNIKLGWAVLIVLAFLACAAAAQNTPKMIHGGILNGKAVSLPKPMYPDEAKVAKIGGTVSVDVTIDEAGNVESAMVKPDPNAMAKENMTVEQEYQSRLRDQLRTAAEDAARQARFSPTLLSGTPVKVSGTIVYNFTPNEDTRSGADIGVGKAINGGVLNGKAISLPHPAYPPAAKAVNAGGAVSVQVLIDENGNVVSATAVSGHPLLRPAAESAARGAKFSPTVLDGSPVKVTGIITYVFQPGDQPKREQSKPQNPMVSRTPILNGRAIKLPKPAYPPAARAVRASGSVSVQVTINENGDVVSASAVSGHPLLRSAAEDAARGAKFRNVADNAPVKVTGIIVYNFVPPDPRSRVL